MCRSIKRLRPAVGSDDPPASVEEVEAAALQFVRKVSGFQRPSPANSEAFEAAVREIAETSARLLASLQVGARSSEASGGDARATRSLSVSPARPSARRAPSSAAPGGRSA